MHPRPMAPERKRVIHLISTADDPSELDRVVWEIGRDRPPFASFQGPDVLRVRYDPDSVTFVPYVAGATPYWLPGAFSVRIDLEEWPYGVEANIEVRDQRPVIARLTVDRERRLGYTVESDDGSSEWRPVRTRPNDITATFLRQLSPQEVLRLAVAAAVHREPGSGGIRADVDQVRAFEDLYAAEQTRERPRGRYSITPEFLTEVAAVYTQALSGGRPVQAVMDRWTPLPRSTALRWIREARQATPPLLPPRGTEATAKGDQE